MYVAANLLRDSLGSLGGANVKKELSDNALLPSDGLNSRLRENIPAREWWCAQPAVVVKGNFSTGANERKKLIARTVDRALEISRAEKLAVFSPERDTTKTLRAARKTRE